MYCYTKALGKTITSKKIKNGKKVEEKREIKTLLLDPPTVKRIIKLVGIDDQKQNINSTDFFHEEVEFISKLYRFIHFTFPLDSEYKMNNLISGILFFAGHDFKSENWIKYEIGKNNQEYREYVEKRIDNDMFASVFKGNRKYYRNHK